MIGIRNSPSMGVVIEMGPVMVKPFFRWYDLRIGAYWDRSNRVLYICPLPMIGVAIYL